MGFSSGEVVYLSCVLSHIEGNSFKMYSCIHVITLISQNKLTLLYIELKPISKYSFYNGFWQTYNTVVFNAAIALGTAPLDSPVDTVMS